MYSIKMSISEEGIKPAKGIGQVVVRNTRHTDHKQAYFQHSGHAVSMTILKSIAHSNHITTFKKYGLSCFEDKRVLVSTNEPFPHKNVMSPVSPATTKRAAASKWRYGLCACCDLAV